ncbi:outer membrane protein assembly factor BamD [Rhodoblastus acidophilus]|uniref:Outer membrane protein assembly factor BamD n=1 Tax=Candidatus Rhodoblastus alkanivorans TaxID=2954117 RepID=A0ABS9Z8C8_9HYPH|nr:outer membrane protein assembly factor BamD [Candidatus Rhodoblastus alkanivorans]MCI4679508.1 outer membrane protein assembly factor BamD [Candidatus Rhodoblastus alkanivorans]MCI4683953.1 outer membrane protein assembly factor BamD [Candidatus Rhodoblastus alkanivorans]MDI4641272.1 outer membrane protein assembly factor BamD [Rhodoblastus acidophilus]
MNHSNVTAIRTFRAVLLAGVALVGFSSAAFCFSLEDLNPFGKSKYEMKVDPVVPPDHLYNEGLAKIQDKDYEAAAKQFANLQKQYPFGEWARKGLVMEVYANYLGGKYIDASTGADRFNSLYPNAPDAPYVNYLAGQAMYGEMPDVERDQDRVVKAQKYYQTVVDKYPKSKYAQDAHLKIDICRDQLAGHELDVGRFYLKRENYTAAINRFREVLFKYQKTREAEEALERLTEAYLAMGITQEAETAAAILGANYPHSQWYKDAYERLQSNGLSPHEHQDSWISKAFKKVGLS